jgi:uncharacterized protein
MILGVEYILIYLLLGAFVGFMAGLFGIGGGGILVPTLATIFLANSVPAENVVHLALGTSMACIIGTSFSSFKAHNKKGGVIWSVFKTLGLGVIFGTFLATFVSSYISSFVLAIIFTCFMIYVSIQMFLNIKPKPSRTLPSDIKQVAAGSFIGMISAMVSIGGGALTVPYLLWHNIDIKKAIGTSAAVGFPIAVSGTIGFMINGWQETNWDSYQLGFVYLPAVILIAISSFFTAPLGVKLVHKLPVGILKKLFAILPLVLSIKMLYSLV